MTLAEPPLTGGSLSAIPGEPIAGRILYRVWRVSAPDGTPRRGPWWFASAPSESDDGGRFDLADPMGTCYLATRAVGAVLEALQAHLVSLPVDELRARQLERIEAPVDAPRAARLTAQVLAGRYGVSASLWAGPDRALTKRWAAAFRRDGWWALYGGLQHDPSGRLRGVALFDHAGDHAPSMGAEWVHATFDLATDSKLHAEMSRYGVTVREPGELPFVTPE